MGLRHAHGYLELRKHSDEVKMVAVCDLYEEPANHVASAVEEVTGERPAVYTDFDRMLEEQKPLDAIDIVTDTRMHHVFAVKALDAGVHVLTEKPMGITIRACQMMRAAAERSGKVLSVAENYRRDPMNRLAKAIIDSGAIGQPYYMMDVGLGGGSALMHDTMWRGLKSRGGYLIDGGVHDADLLIFFMGDVETIYAETGLYTPTRTRIPLAGDIGTFYTHRTEDIHAGAETVEIDQEDTAFATLAVYVGGHRQLRQQQRVARVRGGVEHRSRQQGCNPVAGQPQRERAGGAPGGQGRSDRGGRPARPRSGLGVGRPHGDVLGRRAAVYVLRAGLQEDRPEAAGAGVP